MGIKQFSSSLADFNQQQLDDIKLASDSIKTSVDAIQNTDLASLSTKVDNLGWWSKYTPISKNGLFNSGGNIYKTLYSVTGKGYLSFLSVQHNVIDFYFVKVTIDGVVKYEGRGYSSDHIMGIFVREELQVASTTVALGFEANGGNDIQMSGISPWGTTSTSSAVNVILPQPVFFNSSLLIEVNSLSTNNVDFAYRGGII
jgi:hypothetical protein